jgi:predicted component of type VI protein secretion system
MDYQLVVLKGRSASTAVKLQDGVTSAGRGNDCHLRIRSSQVSRKHCELFEKHGLLLVKDLGSSNGTFVNGKKIDGQRVMEAGDELSIGPITFRVEKIGQPAPARPAAAPAGAPGDTAVTAGVAVADAIPAEDDFEIEFDESPSNFGGDDMGFEIEIDDVVSNPAPAAAADFDIDFEPEAEPEPAPAPAPAPAKATAKAKEPEPAPKPEDVHVADDAIADFLSGIKLDD